MAKCKAVTGSAVKGLIVGVSMYVSLEVAELAKGLVTQVTNVGFFAGVSAFVIPQRSVDGERFATYLANVRPAPGVNLFVLLQTAELRKGFVTSVACVTQDANGIGKCFAAYVTVARSIAGVGADMTGKMVGVSERLVAGGTFVRLDAGMDTFVLLDAA